MDLEPMVEALEHRADRSTLRLSALELGVALAGTDLAEEAVSHLDAALARAGSLEPYDEGLRDGVRAVISGALQARRARALKRAEESAADEVALKKTWGEILERVEPEEIFRPSDVAGRLAKDSSATGKELRAMREKGFLREQEYEDRSSVDGRMKYYQLSETGIRQRERWLRQKKKEQERREVEERRRQKLEQGVERAKLLQSEVRVVHVRDLGAAFVINRRVQSSSTQLKLTSAPCTVFRAPKGPGGVSFTDLGMTVMGVPVAPTAGVKVKLMSGDE